MRESSVFIADEKIIEKYPDVEQVAIILKVKDNTSTFKMTGGEFCGNACRCVVEFMRRNYGYIECIIIINGIKLRGKSNGQTSEIYIYKKDLIIRVDTSNNQFRVL